MPELLLEQTNSRSTKGSSQITDVQATSDVIQDEGERSVTSTETRPAHNVTTTNLRPSVTVQSVKQVHIGMQVTLEIDFEGKTPINPADASLGADC